jgi:hypothetical protein
MIIEECHAYLRRMKYVSEVEGTRVNVLPLSETRLNWLQTSLNDFATVTTVL